MIANDKKELLIKIAHMIEANNEQPSISLEIMNYLSHEELENIYNSLLKRKQNRKEEQENWYNEWINKCAKD